METIFKTWQKATYLEGYFELRDLNSNWASPVNFPTVFTAYGQAIKSGNWQSCTSINTPDYVINNYFDTLGHNKYETMSIMWEYCKKLEKIKWADVYDNINEVKKIIELANIELNKLATI